MRICHLLWSFTRGGTESMLVDIANEQVKDNEVSIVVVNDNIDIGLCQTLDARIQFIQIGRPCGSRNPWYILKMNWHIYQQHPDIVHVHMTGMRRYYRLHIPVVFTAHSNMIGKNDCKYQKVFCISKAVQNTCINLGAKSTTVVYNGIHTDKIRCREFIPEIKKIVCVGRLHAVKGQHLLIEALHILNTELGISNIQLDLIGSGETEHKLKEMVTRFSLEHHVNFLGLQSRNYIYSHLCDYDLYVMPSTNEGFGLTLAEAIAARVPVLSCNLDGPMEVIGYGKYGNFFNAGDAGLLAEMIHMMMCNVPSKSQIEESYQFVVQNFDVSNTSKKYVDEYKLLIKK